MPQKIRMWEVTEQDTLAELTTSEISLEERLENWLESDISMLDPDLLVIGRQVRTDFGGEIDLLCLDSAGDTVVVELKKGRTPREVTAQALDYASWVKDLGFDRIRQIAEEYSKLGGPLAVAFEDKFGEPLPDTLNYSHRSLIVAESMDDSTDRIVRYLSDLHVPVNVATVQHFTDKNGREFLAQVYLVEPNDAEAKSQSSSRTNNRRTVAGLRALAEENSLGNLYRRIEDGVSGIFEARGTASNAYVRYRAKLDEGRTRTVLYVYTETDDDSSGLYFEIQATWLSTYLEIGMDVLKSWLPQNTSEWDASKWPGSAIEEREGAIAFGGYFHTEEEVDRFIAGLRASDL